MDLRDGLLDVYAFELLNSPLRQNLPDFKVVLVAKAHECFCFCEVFYQPYCLSMDGEATEDLGQLGHMENLYCTLFETKDYEFLIHTLGVGRLGDASLVEFHIENLGVIRDDFILLPRG